METTLQYRKDSCMRATEPGSKQTTVFPTKEVNPTFSLAVTWFTQDHDNNNKKYMSEI